MTIATGARILAADIRDQAVSSGATVGRARRDTNSSTTTSTTRVAVLRLPPVAVKQGRSYRIKSSTLTVDGPTASDALIADLVYTTDGSTPSTSSTQLPGSEAHIQQPNATPFISGIIDTTYVPAADQSLSLLLCIRHEAGTGAMAINATGVGTICQITVTDEGVDPGNTGVAL